MPTETGAGVRLSIRFYDYGACPDDQRRAARSTAAIP